MFFGLYVFCIFFNEKQVFKFVLLGKEYENVFIWKIHRYISKQDYSEKMYRFEIQIQEL